MRILLALGACCVVIGCDGDTDSAVLSSTPCGVGTTLDNESETCVPTLGDGVEVNTEGTIVHVVDDGAETAEAAYARGLDDGVASVTLLNCGDGTEINEAGDACVPTADFQDALRAEGAAAVTPLNCADGTEINEAGDACVPTEAFQAALRAEGAASVTPLNCGEGTEVNAAGDARVPTEAFRRRCELKGSHP